MPGTPQAREKHNKSFVGDITTVEHSAKEGLDTYTAVRVNENETNLLKV
jgi:hypothetical protein